MIYILIGLISGIFSGIGMGGGTILLLILTTILGMEQHVAQAVNLIFFIPTSIAAIIMNIKNKSVDLKLIGIVASFGIIGAIIGSKLVVKTDVSYLKKIFGAFLIVIAINEIYETIKEYINN
ncbi:MAG: sulfite exporter TauE/SafE family protein [Clostridia bacterium]|nr:sulfite exporter TauE/SafE family protein [Clostridia bacterium]